MPAKNSFLRKYRQLPLTYLNFKTGYRICFRATGCFMTRNLRASMVLPQKSGPTLTMSFDKKEDCNAEEAIHA